MRILIADDNASVREGIAELIRDNGWEISGQASNGLETLQQVRTLKPDVILLDVCMPGMNGLEIAATIKQELPNIKVLIMSHYDLDEMLVGAQRHLADGFIDKGQLARDLVQTIHKTGSSSVPRCQTAARPTPD